MVTHTQNLCSGQPFMLRRPGSSWGFGALLKSWYWWWRRCCTFTPPTYNSCRSETRTHNLWITKPDSLTVRPRLPQIYWSILFKIILCYLTVILSRFGAFLTSLLTFAQHLVQPPQHLVICAHHSSSFSFLPTNCKCFWTCINCFHTTLCCFITLSFAYVMSVKIN